MKVVKFSLVLLLAAHGFWSFAEEWGEDNLTEFSRNLSWEAPRSEQRTERRREQRRERAAEIENASDDLLLEDYGIEEGADSFGGDSSGSEGDSGWGDSEIDRLFDEDSSSSSGSNDQEFETENEPEFEQEFEQELNEEPDAFVKEREPRRRAPERKHYREQRPAPGGSCRISSGREYPEVDAYHCACSEVKNIVRQHRYIVVIGKGVFGSKTRQLIGRDCDTAHYARLHSGLCFVGYTCGDRLKRRRNRRHFAD